MSKTTPRPQTKQQRRQDRREEQKRQQAAQAAQKNKRILITIVSAIVAIVLVLGINFLIQNAKSNATSDNAAYPSIDNIPCNKSEQLNYHVHAHLSIYINGQPFQLPTNLGIASDQSCLYWLHTHDSTGVIHIEAPGQQSFALGTFFQEWSTRFPQMTYPTELDSTSGWVAYVNGKPYKGDFHTIPLVAHTLITLAYNSPGVKPDTTYAWQGL